MQEEHAVIVSTDDVHIPGSVKRTRTDPAALGASIVSFHLASHSNHAANDAKKLLCWKPSDLTASLSASLSLKRGIVTELSSQPNVKAAYSVLGEFLYGLENLRKNRSGDEAADEPVQDEVPAGRDTED